MPGRMPQAGPGSPAEATGLFMRGKRAEATSCLSPVRAKRAPNSHHGLKAIVPLLVSTPLWAAGTWAGNTE